MQSRLSTLLPFRKSDDQFTTPDFSSPHPVKTSVYIFKALLDVNNFRWGYKTLLKQALKPRNQSTAYTRHLMEQLNWH